MAYATICSDSFDRANANLNGSTLDNANGGSNTETWVDKVGTWLIDSTACKTPSAAAADYVTVTSAADGAKQKVSCRLIGPSMGPIARWTTGTGIGNLYLFLIGDAGGAGTSRIYKCVNGSFTALGSAGPGGIASNQTITLECSGTTITGYVNGVQECQVTDSTHSSGAVGFYGAIPQSAVDDFKYELDAGGSGSAVPVFMNQYRQRRA
jgi:hypothetical protein